MIQNYQLANLQAELERLREENAEQRMLLLEALDYLSDTDPSSEFVEAITQHLKKETP